jgi:hypothetical protein
MDRAGDAVQSILFSPIISHTVTTTATEGQGDGVAAVISSADLFS